MAKKRKNPNRNKAYFLYRILYLIARFLYPKMEAEGLENLPEKPAIFVGNHSQLHGPMACELYFPVPRYTWCIGEMLNWKGVPAYAFADFWSEKPRYTHWFYKLLSYLIVPLSVVLFPNANTIGVYHDARILSTFKQTLRRIQEGNSIVIFPECGREHNHIVNEFQRNFVDVAKLYTKKTQKDIDFVPFYLAPNLKKMYIGKPTRLCPDVPMEEERTRICTYLMEEITAMAESLPRHRVVPYKNLPKKNHPWNRP